MSIRLDQGIVRTQSAIANTIYIGISEMVPHPLRIEAANYCLDSRSWRALQSAPDMRLLMRGVTA